MLTRKQLARFLRQAAASGTFVGDINQATRAATTGELPPPPPPTSVTVPKKTKLPPIKAPKEERPVVEEPTPPPPPPVAPITPPEPFLPVSVSSNRQRLSSGTRKRKSRESRASAPGKRRLTVGLNPGAVTGPVGGVSF